MSLERDYDLLTTAAALCEPPRASRLELLELMGPDRERFFGGMVTSAVEGLEPGSGAFGFITDVRGRVLASATVLALEDRLWLEIPRGRGRTIIDHLEKYIVTDQVEILPLGDMASVRVVGPNSAAALADLGATAANDLTEPWSHAQVDILDYQARLVREGYLAVARLLPMAVLSNRAAPGPRPRRGGHPRGRRRGDRSPSHRAGLSALGRRLRRLEPAPGNRHRRRRRLREGLLPRPGDRRPHPLPGAAGPPHVPARLRGGPPALGRC